MSWLTALSRSLRRIQETTKENLLAAEGLQLQVSGVGGHRQDTERVGVAETALPALHSDDGRAGFDDVEVERAAQTEADTVVDLRQYVRSCRT